MSGYNPYIDRCPQLFLDFDDTIVNSLETCVDYLNKIYDTNVKATDIKKWDMSDKFPMMERDIKNGIIVDPFESEYFWNHLELRDGALNMLKEMDKGVFDIFIVSKGTKKNLEKKIRFIRENIMTYGIKVQFIPLKLNDVKVVRCTRKDSLSIDDNADYLRESNASIKILFKAFDNVEWNADWQGAFITSWSEESIDMLRTTSTLLKGISDRNYE